MPTADDERITDLGGGWFEVGEFKVQGEGKAVSLLQDIEDERWELGRWNEHLNYECTECPYSTLDKENIIDHWNKLHMTESPEPTPDPEPQNIRPRFEPNEDEQEPETESEE